MPISDAWKMKEMSRVFSITLSAYGNEIEEIIPQKSLKRIFPFKINQTIVRARNIIITLCASAGAMAPLMAQIPAGLSGFKGKVAPFLKKNCIECHSPKKSKGKVTLHDISGDLSSGEGLDRWEDILDMLESGEMPPEDEPQPDEAERQAIVEWIEAGLRNQTAKAKDEKPQPTARRLTNFEYQNTMRDLLGFELDLITDLSKDPTKPYHFNNTAQFMLLGPEQIDRYLAGARRAMASAIVDPEKPEVFTTRREWQPKGAATGAGGDEVALWSNGRGTPGGGFGLKGFPKTGEFRIRVQASAILPQGIKEMPLRIVMGYDLGHNSSMLQMEPVGTARLTNTPDNPQTFEFRGRIENFPPRPGKSKKGVRQPDSMSITPQNLYDDGTLNDENRFLYWPRRMKMPRAVVNWIEFEGPITDVWPPEHHNRILFESTLRKTNPKAYVKEVLTRFISRAFRRPASNEEVNRFMEIYAIVAPEMGTMEAAMRETLSMVLITPQFLLHTKADGEVVSKQYELASELSYFLWGSMPDEALLKLAAEGKLDNDKVIAQQVKRLLADERSADFVRNFTVQWMSLDKMKTVPINKDLFPRFLFYVPAGERAGTEEPYRPTIRDFMIDETVNFVAEMIRRNASVLNVIDSDFAVLNQPLAAHYGVEGVQGNQFRPVAIKPKNHLGGLLTHGSVLVGNGTGSAPHPIYRAVWLREAILGDEVKPPPADIPSLADTVGESSDNALSIKDLLAQHRTKESCMDCHVRLDPWGIPFEQYNAVGKYQPLVPKDGTRVRAFNRKKDANLDGYLDYIKTISTVEVDAVARVPHGPEVQGMDDLKAFLIKERKADVAENVVRRLLGYGLGRELTYRDRFTVEEIVGKGAKAAYPLQDMIVAICQSEAFRGKTEK